MSDAGLKPRDIVEMMPADTRNPHLGTEWSWLTERTKKAKLARKSSQEAARDVALVKSEGASQPTGQGMPAKVVGSSHINCTGVSVRSEAAANIPASHALIPGTMTKPIRDTPSPTVDGRAPSSSHVVSIPEPTTGQLGSENAVAMVTPKSTHSASVFGVPSLSTPAQIDWQLAQAAITQSSRTPAAATPRVAAVTPIAIDGPPPAHTVITEGNQFVFQPSPPKETPASQYSAEYRHKEGLREEIRTHLGLLVDISSMEESFVSRSQQQQQNDILLQWKKWCDDQSYRLGKEHGVFVGPTLTGFVIKDALTRLLGTLTMINLRYDGSGRFMAEEFARSRALEYTEALFKQHTWDLRVRASQPLPPTAPAATPLGCSVPVPQSIAANGSNIMASRYGYYGVELSSAAITIVQQSPEDVVNQATGEQHISSAYPPPEYISAAIAPAAPTSTAQHDDQQVRIRQPTYACFACSQAKRRCDRVLPACSTCQRFKKDCTYDKG
jgi:hypothetical protein